MSDSFILSLLHSTVLFLFPSGVNIKVQIHASGPDRINVLPPRKGRPVMLVVSASF